MIPSGTPIFKVLENGWQFNLVILNLYDTTLRDWYFVNSDIIRVHTQSGENWLEIFIPKETDIYGGVVKSFLVKESLVLYNAVV